MHGCGLVPSIISLAGVGTWWGPPFTTRLRRWNTTQHKGWVDVVALCLSVNISSVRSKRPQNQLRHAQ
jgi:hypothetical protein